MFHFYKCNKHHFDSCVSVKDKFESYELVDLPSIDLFDLCEQSSPALCILEKCPH